MHFPVGHSLLDLPQDGCGALLVEPEEWSDFQRQIEAQSIVGLRDVEAEPCSIGLGIQIVSGRKFPAAFRKQKAMVAKMIVGILDGDREDDPSPQLCGSSLAASS